MPSTPKRDPEGKKQLGRRLAELRQRLPFSDPSLFVRRLKAASDEISERNGHPKKELTITILNNYETGVTIIPQIIHEAALELALQNNLNYDYLGKRKDYRTFSVPMISGSLSEKQLSDIFERYRGTYFSYYSMRRSDKHGRYMARRVYVIDDYDERDGSLVGHFKAESRIHGKTISGVLKMIVGRKSNDVFYALEIENGRTRPPISMIVRGGEIGSMRYLFGIELAFRSIDDDTISSFKVLWIPAGDDPKTHLPKRCIYVDPPMGLDQCISRDTIAILEEYFDGWADNDWKSCLNAPPEYKLYGQAAQPKRNFQGRAVSGIVARYLDLEQYEQTAPTDKTTQGS